MFRYLFTKHTNFALRLTAQAECVCKSPTTRRHIHRSSTKYAQRLTQLPQLHADSVNARTINLVDTKTNHTGRKNISDINRRKLARLRAKINESNGNAVWKILNHAQDVHNSRRNVDNNFGVIGDIDLSRLSIDEWCGVFKCISRYLVSTKPENPKDRHSTIAKSGYSMERVWKMFEMSLSESSSPDALKLESIIHSICRTGDIETTLKAYQFGRSRNVHISNRIYNYILISISQSLKDLKSIYPALVQHIPENVHLKEALALSSNDNSDVSTLHITYLLLQHLKSHNLEPDSYTYNILLQIALKYETLDTAYQIFRIMQTSDNHKHLIDIVTYNTLLKGHIKNKDYEGVIKLYESHILPEEVKPDNGTYTILADAYAHLKNRRGVEEMWNTLRQRSMSSSLELSTLITFFNSFVKIGDYHTALSIFETTRSRFPVPHTMIPNLVVAVSRTEGVKEAETVVSDLKKSHRLELDSTVYSTLVTEYLKRDGDEECQSGVALFNKMTEKGSIPSKQAIVELLNYRFDKGEVGAAEELVSTAKESWGLIMNSELLESMLCGYIKNRQNDKAILIYADARRLNIQPSIRLFCETTSVLLNLNAQTNSRFISFETNLKTTESNRLKLDSKLSDSFPKSNPFSILEAMMRSLKSPIEIRSRSHAQIIQSLFRLLWKSPYALSAVNMITHLLSSPKNIVPDTIIESILEPSIPSVKIENIASQYLSFLSAQNREPSPRMLERLIYVFANAQKPQQAIQLFYQLESYRHSSSSSTLASTLVSPLSESLYTSILLSLPSQPSFAVQHIPNIINSLFTNHPSPKLSTLSSIITMYTRLNDLESALSYYTKLESDFGYTPTLEIHTTILNGYIQSRQFNSATALFNELQSQYSTSESSGNQVTLDTPILNVIMNAYRSQGRIDDVWRVYHHIEDTTGLDGTSLLVLLRAVITHYDSIKSQLGSTDVSTELKFEKVKDVMRRVYGNGKEKNLKLDRRHWHSYIHICGVSGNQEEFIWIFKKMCRPFSPCSPLSSSHSSTPPSLPPRSRNHFTQHHHTPTKKTYTLLFSYLYPSPISFHTTHTHTHTHNINNQEPESESSRLLKIRSRLHYLFKRSGKGRKCIVKSEIVKDVMVKRVKEMVGSQWMYHGKI